MGGSRAKRLLTMALMATAWPGGGLSSQEVKELETAVEPTQEERQPLRLSEVLSLALERSPRLRAARFRVEVIRNREEGAGVLPDPTVQLGVMNLALPELSATMPASMAPTVQAMQRFPLAGKLSLRAEMARQSTDIEMAASQEVWWEVRTEAAAAFYRIYRLDRQVEVMEQTLGLLREFEAVARSMYSTGQGRQADVLRANVEVARLRADIQRLAAMRIGSAAHLNSLLDRPADTPVGTPVLDSLPASVPERVAIREWALESRPALAELRAELDRAGTQRALAERSIWPDLTVGLQYGLGRMDRGYKSMGGASVGFSLPIHAGKRQHKAREEALAAEGMVRARLDHALALVDARIGEVLANLEQGRILLGLYADEILPQARATVASSLASYRTGEVDFMTLVDAQMAANRFQGEYYQLLATYGTAVAQLEMTIGRDLPGSADLIRGDR